jgi:hypothetical protein
MKIVSYIYLCLSFIPGICLLGAQLETSWDILPGIFLAIILSPSLTLVGLILGVINAIYKRPNLRMFWIGAGISAWPIALFLLVIPISH